MNTDDWDISMIEKHHVHKKDAPSGTAKTLQKYHFEIPVLIFLASH